MDSSEREVNEENFKVRDAYFDEKNMFTRVRSFAASEKLEETYRALEYMRERHAGQYRKPGKFLDRCNNVSTMGCSFDKARRAKYIRETEEYVLPLTEILKNRSLQYSDLAFLIRYQIISILETIKCLDME